MCAKFFVRRTPLTQDARMSIHPHEVIRASAGSGKTYQLTLRFLRLLALGAEPDHIVVLTFTRKVAGEFFVKIVERLAAAAESEANACALAQELAAPYRASAELANFPSASRLDAATCARLKALTPADFRRLLRSLIDRLHRLRLGTMDGFFARILRSFPYEFGLSGDFSVPTEELARLERQRVLGQLFEVSPEGLTGPQRDFFEAFKQATWGKEEYALSRLLDEFVEAYHGWLLNAPYAEQWGHPAAIWSHNLPFTRLTDEEITSRIALVRQALEGMPFTVAQQERWTSLWQAFAAQPPPSAFDRPFDYFIKKLPTWPAAGGLEPVEVKIDRKAIRFSPDQWRAFRELLEHLLAREIEAACARTRGVWLILNHYETAYHELVRRAGRLSFSDVQTLLAGQTAAQRRSGQPPPLEQLELAWRLDGRFDHWLLDEFQDTSLLQWRILHPLVSEALQDDSGRRTYFHVGDAKQAIYNFRDGEARLTDLILQQYGEGINLRSLDTSYRSSPEVLAAVNAVFGAKDILREQFPGEPVQRWLNLWRPHCSSTPKRPGYAALVRPLDLPESEEQALPLPFPEATAAGEDYPAGGPDPGSPYEKELRTIALLLLELNPPARGLTCAILTRSNNEAHQAALWLRYATGLPVVAEGRETPGWDNHPARSLLTLLHYAVHPGDTLAREVVRQSPLQEIAAAHGWEVGSLPRRVLWQLFNEGLTRCLAFWCRELENVRPELDAFNRQRLEYLQNLAEKFEQEGGSDIDEFLALARSATQKPEAEDTSTIRCLTIHSSKGLEYDIVFLPRLDGDSFTNADTTWLRARRGNLETAWHLRVGRKELAEADPVLQRVREAMLGEAVYEEFCCLYVAMTRAKRALYMVSAPFGSSNKSGSSSKRNALSLIDTALAKQSQQGSLRINGVTLEAAWHTGDPHWYHSCQPPAPPSAAPPEEEATAHVFFPAPAHAERLKRRLPQTPSAQETWTLKLEALASPERATARQVGEFIHALFAQVVHPADPSALRAWFQQHHPEPTPATAAALEQVEACLADAALRALLLPEGDIVWRERRFEIVLDDAWITGMFDRVHVGPGRARLIDFKTDAVNPAEVEDRATIYRPQMHLYRRALAQLLKLDPSAIEVWLIFTACRQAVAVS